MRKTIIYALAGIAAFCMTACDDVKEGDRYEEMGEVKAERNVLLEDFTGQYCLNCPNAHKVIEDLEEQYGSDRLVAVSIHCGGFGLSNQYTDFSTGTVGLMTQEGNEILSGYPISSFPMGVINGGSPETHDAWAASVRTAISTPSDVTISATAKFVPNTSGDGEIVENGHTLKDGKTGTIEITADVMTGADRTANVHFWIVESGIVGIQRQPDGSFNQEYVHNNVFRAWVLGSNGKSVTFTEGISQNITGSIECRYTDQEHWIPENLAVVVFVSDGGVLQVERVDVATE